jgi:hypothetical protein
VDLSCLAIIFLSLSLFDLPTISASTRLAIVGQMPVKLRNARGSFDYICIFVQDLSVRVIVGKAVALTRESLRRLEIFFSPSCADEDQRDDCACAGESCPNRHDDSKGMNKRLGDRITNHLLS